LDATGRYDVMTAALLLVPETRWPRRFCLRFSSGFLDKCCWNIWHYLCRIVIAH